MKLGILGDIHGNHFALKAVLDAARRHGAKRLIITGDLVGYYFWPKEVLTFLSQWDVAVVRGNHEIMLDEARKSTDYLALIEGKFGTGTRIAVEQLETEQLNLLCSLPHPLEISVEKCRIMLCHGAPWDLNQYIYPDAESEMLKRCAMQEYDLVVMGHTHYPMNAKIGKTLLVNPGSVGQPRNRQPGAHWALFDTESREVSMRCESYDAWPVIAESHRRHPDINYLAEVLERT
jgi:putative phosphoesterase